VQLNPLKQLVDGCRHKFFLISKSHNLRKNSRISTGFCSISENGFSSSLTFSSTRSPEKVKKYARDSDRHKIRQVFEILLNPLKKGDEGGKLLEITS